MIKKCVNHITNIKNYITGTLIRLLTLISNVITPLLYLSTQKNRTAVADIREIHQKLKMI
jgi:hypothetical protein